MISAEVEVSHCSHQIDNSGAGNLEAAVRPKPHLLRAKVAFTDGGGHGSSADWLVPREAKDILGPLRHSFLSLAAKWNLVERLSAHVAARRAECLFNTEEISFLREQLVSFLARAGCPCSAKCASFSLSCLMLGVA